MVAKHTTKRLVGRRLVPTTLTSAQMLAALEALVSGPESPKGFGARLTAGEFGKARRSAHLSLERSRIKRGEPEEDWHLVPTDHPQRWLISFPTEPSHAVRGSNYRGPAIGLLFTQKAAGWVACVELPSAETDGAVALQVVSYATSDGMMGDELEFRRFLKAFTASCAGPTDGAAPAARSITTWAPPTTSLPPPAQGGRPAAAAAAGWLADPLARHELRYWDGMLWSEHVSDNGRTGLDPLTR